MEAMIDMGSREFSQFLENERTRRRLSIRQFSELVGVSHSTMLRLMNEKVESAPSLEVLLSVSRAVHVDVCSLVAMIFPEEASMDVETRILAQRIERLPVEARKAIHQLITGFKE